VDDEISTQELRYFLQEKIISIYWKLLDSELNNLREKRDDTPNQFELIRLLASIDVLEEMKSFPKYLLANITELEEKSWL